MTGCPSYFEQKHRQNLLLEEFSLSSVKWGYIDLATLSKANPFPIPEPAFSSLCINVIPRYALKALERLCISHGTYQASHYRSLIGDWLLDNLANSHTLAVAESSVFRKLLACSASAFSFDQLRTKVVPALISLSSGWCFPRACCCFRELNIEQ